MHSYFHNLPLPNTHLSPPILSRLFGLQKKYVVPETSVVPLNDALGRLAWLQGRGGGWWHHRGGRGVGQTRTLVHNPVSPLSSAGSEKNQTGGTCCTYCGWQTLSQSCHMLTPCPIWPPPLNCESIKHQFHFCTPGATFDLSFLKFKNLSA